MAEPVFSRAAVEKFAEGLNLEAETQIPALQFELDWIAHDYRSARGDPLEEWLGPKPRPAEKRRRLRTARDAVARAETALSKIDVRIMLEILPAYLRGSSARDAPPGTPGFLTVLSRVAEPRWPDPWTDRRALRRLAAGLDTAYRGVPLGRGRPALQNLKAAALRLADLYERASRKPFIRGKDAIKDPAFRVQEALQIIDPKVTEKNLGTALRHATHVLYQRRLQKTRV